MDFDGVQRNAVGEPTYTVAFPVATAAKPDISEADAAYANDASQGGGIVSGSAKVAPEPAEMERPVDA